MQTMLSHYELTWLKQKAKKAGIPLDKNLMDSEQYNYIIEELGNKGHREVVEELYMNRKEIVEQTCKDPIPLIKWLYENQSARLFGAENRIFVILVDSTDMNQSWKMKRAFSLIEPKVKDYLQQFNFNSLKNIEFIFNHNKYRCLADTIFIIKK